MQTEIKTFINFQGWLDLEVPKRFGLLFYLRWNLKNLSRGLNPPKPV